MLSGQSSILSKTTAIVSLDRLLKGVNRKEIHGEPDRVVNGISTNHSDISPNDIFVCYKGVNVDGHRFIPEAIEKGAAVIVGELPAPIYLPIDVTYVQTDDGRNALSKISANLYGNPADRLSLIGITGTNGKTSIAHCTEAIFTASDQRCGLIGTVSRRIGDLIFPANCTTPHPIELHKFFHNATTKGIDRVVMEASSQGLAQQRLAGVTFDVVVFTNLTRDHLDYHENMTRYLEAKLQLFRQVNPDSLAIVNLDQEVSKKFIEATNAKIMTYGINSPKPDLTVRNVTRRLTGSTMVAVTPSGEIEIDLPLPGHHNIYNALATIGIGLHFGSSLEQLKQGLETVKIPGRFELIDRGQDFAVVVDYAHTPDALENLLNSATKILSGGKLITVFGCGGDRDRKKRPLMGEIASRISDQTIITSDNPRSENPDQIITEIVDGIDENASYEIVVDRREAIEKAISVARSGDLVMVAGKGHENYQLIGNEKIDFDDRKIAEEFLSTKS